MAGWPEVTHLQGHNVTYTYEPLPLSLAKGQTMPLLALVKSVYFLSLVQAQCPSQYDHELTAGGHCWELPKVEPLAIAVLGP
jgi:hypothetical protein